MANKDRNRKKAGARDSRASRFYVVLGVVAVVGVAAVAYAVSSARGTTASGPVEIEGLDDPQRLAELAQGVSMGQGDAPVTVVEFGDYQCPGCGWFAGEVKPRVQLAYVETGKVRFVFYDFPLEQHPHSFLAARAARCAGEQDRFWEYHDALFARQQRWSGASSVVGLFKSYAEELGLDGDDFESCLESERFADVVTANKRLGEELGVNQTPTIMVSPGGMYRSLAEPSFEAIQEAVDELLGDAGASG